MKITINSNDSNLIYKIEALCEIFPKTGESHKIPIKRKWLIFSITDHWLSIEDNGYYYGICRSYYKDSHFSFENKTVVVEIRKDGYLNYLNQLHTGVFQSAITMHPVYSVSGAERLYWEICKEIDSAYKSI